MSIDVKHPTDEETKTFYFLFFTHFFSILIHPYLGRIYQRMLKLPNSIEEAHPPVTSVKDIRPKSEPKIWNNAQWDPFLITTIDLFLPPLSLLNAKVNHYSNSTWPQHSSIILTLPLTFPPNHPLFFNRRNLIFQLRSPNNTHTYSTNKNNSTRMQIQLQHQNQINK